MIEFNLEHAPDNGDISVTKFLNAEQNGDISVTKFLN